MTLTTTAVSQATTFRGWFQAACHLFAPTPPTASAPPRTAADATSNTTATRSPMRRNCTAPDPGPMPAAPGIQPQDWDLLFRAVLERLARVAVEKAPPDGTLLRLQPPGTALGECMDALEQLRRSVPLAQDHEMPRPDPPDGAIAARVPASPSED